MERWGQINYSKIINVMTVQMTFHICNSCYKSWDISLFKAIVFWFCQLKKKQIMSIATGLISIQVFRKKAVKLFYWN